MANKEQEIVTPASTIQDAQTLQGENGAYYLNRANHTGSLNLYNFGSTQWSKSIPTTSIPNGTFINGFSVFDNVIDKVPSGTTTYDELNINASGYIVIPYIGKPYEGQLLNHIIRVNFNIDAGNLQTLRLELRRAIDDTVVGSPIQLQRNPDETGQQIMFLTYTSSSSDPFAVDGFYIALVNESGVSISVSGNAGVYIKTFFQKPVEF